MSMRAAVVDIWVWSAARWPAHAVPGAELDSGELAQAEALGRRASGFIVNRALVRRLLSRYAAVPPTGWEFSRNACGKPVVRAAGVTQPPHFNLSHAGEYTLCAVSPAVAVGIDIEAHDNGAALLAVADQYFSERELADLRALPEALQASTFFDYWTLKEAYLKARGEGLVQPLDSFSFFPEDEDNIGFECAPEYTARDAAGPVAWDFTLLRLAAGYTAALAVQHPAPRLRYWAMLPDGPVEVANAAALAAMLRGEIG
jgi:4'-phosphopantetheinyl transferase